MIDLREQIASLYLESDDLASCHTFADKVIEIFNQWLEEQGATHLAWMPCDDGYKRKSVEPLRMEESI